MLQGLEHFCYGDRLRELGLYRLEKRKLHRDHRALSSAWSERKGGMTLTEGRVRLDIREEILPCESGQALKQIAQKSSAALYLEVFKVRLDRAWSNFI